MKYHLISKKSMREKDFKSLKDKNPGYLRFSHEGEILHRTPRGWFLTFTEKEERICGEVSITTAQMWLNSHGMNYSTGW